MRGGGGGYWHVHPPLLNSKYRGWQNHMYYIHMSCILYTYNINNTEFHYHLQGAGQHDVHTYIPDC